MQKSESAISLELLEMESTCSCVRSLALQCISTTPSIEAQTLEAPFPPESFARASWRFSGST